MRMSGSPPSGLMNPHPEVEVEPVKVSSLPALTRASPCQRWANYQQRPYRRKSLRTDDLLEGVVAVPSMSCQTTCQAVYQRILTRPKFRKETRASVILAKTSRNGRVLPYTRR